MSLTSDQAAAVEALAKHVLSSEDRCEEVSPREITEILEVAQEIQKGNRDDSETTTEQPPEPESPNKLVELTGREEVTDAVGQLTGGRGK